MSDAILLTERPAPGVVVLTLNRPNKLNALSITLLTELAAALDEVKDDPGTGCVVLTGSGRAFSAGADIGDMLDTGDNVYQDRRRLGPWERISEFRKPIIAAVNGYALGGGLELALLCDFIIASETAKFGTPEINLGTFPGDGATQRLPRLIGKAFAMQMVLTGEMIDAQVAERKGLVNEVVPGGNLIARANEIAASIAAKSSAITPLAKQAILIGLDQTLSEGLKTETRLVLETAKTADRAEGLVAFKEKRPPRFIGR